MRRAGPAPPAPDRCREADLRCVRVRRRRDQQHRLEDRRQQARGPMLPAMRSEEPNLYLRAPPERLPSDGSGSDPAVHEDEGRNVKKRARVTTRLLLASVLVAMAAGTLAVLE